MMARALDEDNTHWVLRSMHTISLPMALSSRAESPSRTYFITNFNDSKEVILSDPKAEPEGSTL